METPQFHIRLNHGQTRTWTESCVVDGSCVAVDLLQTFIAACVPDRDGAVFRARHQQSPGWIQTYGVHLDMDQQDREITQCMLSSVTSSCNNIFISQHNLVLTIKLNYNLINTKLQWLAT